MATYPASGSAQWLDGVLEGDGGLEVPQPGHGGGIDVARRAVGGEGAPVLGGARAVIAAVALAPVAWIHQRSSE